MDNLLRSLQRAAQDLMAPRMLALVLWPMGLSLLLWGGLAWLFGAAWKAEIADFLAATPFQGLLHWAGAEWLMAYAAIIILALLWLPALYLTALLITSLFLMPLIVNFVAERHYPDLARLKGGSLAGSIVNGVLALLLYILAWVLILPVWLFAPFGIAVSILLNAWLNQRLFMYDALSDHASAEELKDERHAGGGWLYALSSLLGLLHFVPLVNFLAPVYMGLAFTHHGLGALDSSRKGAAA
jgi:signal transduction histidine kinase